MSNDISVYTNKIRAKLPYWFTSIRKNDESIGAQFLNVFGILIEDAMNVIEYAYEQCTFNTSTDQIYTVYKTFMPIKIEESDDITITSGTWTLQPVHTLDDFYADVIVDTEHFLNQHLIDYEKRLIYVRLPFNADEVYKYGWINVRVRRNGSTVFNRQLPLVMHPVWNYLDELGLLLTTTRRLGEDNVSYKSRLMQVFKYPCNTTKQGLINGICKELGLRKEVQWDNDSVDFIIRNIQSREGEMVILNSIHIDDVLASSNQIYYDTINNRINLRIDNPLGISHKVSWIYGFSIHELQNKSDGIIQEQIDRPDKTMLQYILDTINKEAPILWGHFIWDESYWDISEQLTGRTPFIFDARYLGG